MTAPSIYQKMPITQSIGKFFGFGFYQNAKINNCAAVIGNSADFACKVALLVILALGLAGVLPTTCVAGCSIGLTGGILISNLINGKPNAIKACALFLTGMQCIVTLTLGGLAIDGLLNIHQLAIGVLVTYFWMWGLMTACCLTGIFCSPCLSSSLSSIDLLSQKNLPQKLFG